MGIFDVIKNAISLEEEDDDSLYEAEMRELERKERSKNANARRSKRIVDDELDEDDEDIEERPVSRRVQRSSISDRRTSDRRKTSISDTSERGRTQTSRRNYDTSRITPPRSPESSYSQRRNTSTIQRRPQNDDNIVNMRRDTSEISILKLQTLADAQEVCDSLIDGRPIIVSFEDPHGPEAQRIMDFISGCLYVMNGNLHTISDSIFLFSPKGVDVSGDYLNMMQNSGFGIPTFNKMM